MLKNHKYFHWLYFEQGKKHFFNLGSGVFFWIFFVLTQPFGIYDNNLSSFWLLMLILLPPGLLFTLISYMFDYLAIDLWSYDIRQSIRKDLIIWFVKLAVVVHIIFLIRSMLCDGACVDLGEYFQLWLAYFLMFSLTYWPFLLYGKYLYFHSMLGREEDGSDHLELRGKGKERLVLVRSQVAYFKSDDNYVEVYILKGKGELEKVLFRATLKHIQNQLSGEHQFVRIHRSFIVNLRYVLYSGRKDTLELKYGDSVVELPVSRKYQKEVAELFIHPK